MCTPGSCGLRAAEPSPFEYIGVHYVDAYYFITGQRPLPRQALIGVAVNEAVRLSLDNGNAYVVFDGGMNPRVAG